MDFINIDNTFFTIVFILQKMVCCDLSNTIFDHLDLPLISLLFYSNHNILCQ